MMKSSRATSRRALEKISVVLRRVSGHRCGKLPPEPEPAPVRWFLRLTGAQTDRETVWRSCVLPLKGLLSCALRTLVASRCRFARQDDATARELLSGLAKEFPDNGLFKKELDRIKS